MKKTFYSVLALVALASCSKSDETSLVATDSEVLISSSIETRTVGNLWESGDAIGVYMTTDVEDSYSFGDLRTNVKYTTTDDTDTSYASGNFTSTSPLYYPVSGSVDLLAYYPYADGTTNAGSYTVNVGTQTDQGAIDLMKAEVSSQAKSSDPVNFNFYHKLSRIELTIKKGGGLVDADLKDMTVTLSGTITEATYDLTKEDTGSPITFDSGASADDITMLTTADETSGVVTTAEAIVIPQDGLSTTLKFAVGDNTYTASITTAAFVIGKEYKYTVTINNTGVTISSATINDWGDGTEGESDDDDDITAEPTAAIS